MSCRSNFESPQHLRVSVEFEQSRFVIALNRADVSFAEVVAQLAFILQRPSDQLRTQRFVCGGCRRTLFAQRERKERLPSSCCPAKGLQIITMPAPDFDDQYIYAEPDKTPTSTPVAERRVFVQNPQKSATLRPQSVKAVLANVKKKSATLPSKRRSQPNPEPSKTVGGYSLHSDSNIPDFRDEEHSLPSSENQGLTGMAQEPNFHSPRRESDFHYEELEDQPLPSRENQELTGMAQGPNFHSPRRESDFHYEELEDQPLPSRENQGLTGMAQGPNFHSPRRESDFHYEELEDQPLPSRENQGLTGMAQGPIFLSTNRASEFDYEELEDQPLPSRENLAATEKEKTFIQLEDCDEGANESNVDEEDVKEERLKEVHCPPPVVLQHPAFNNDLYAPSALVEDDSAPILDGDSDAPRMVRIQLTLPDCEPLSVHLSRETTVSAFLESSLFNRKWFPVADVVATSCGSLLKVGDDWPTWTLSDCGVGDGDEIVLEPDAPPSVHVSLFCPLHFEALRTEQVDLDKGDWNWGRVQARVAERCQDSQEVMYPSDLTHQILLLNGCLAMLFLEPSSGFNFSAGELPQICVLKDTDVLLVSNKDLEWAQPSSVSVFEGRWLLMLSGFTTSDLRLDGMFVAVDQKQFVSASSGQVFESREAAIATLPGAFESSLRGFVMLLENGNRVPRWRLARGVRPQVWGRRGRAVEVREGRVRAACREDIKFADSAWLRLRDDGKLVKDLARAIRKGRPVRE